jgi:hypothetical protein
MIGDYEYSLLYKKKVGKLSYNMFKKRLKITFPHSLKECLYEKEEKDNE